MMDPITCPERLALRPHVGELPIPFVTRVGADGVADFKVHDDARRLEIAECRLCQLCGTALDAEIVFVGTPGSCERATFGEPPMHRDCLEFAWRVCPWLNGGDWRIAERAGIEVVPRPADASTLGIHTCAEFTVTPDSQRGRGIKFRAGPALRPTEWRSR